METMQEKLRRIDRMTRFDDEELMTLEMCRRYAMLVQAWTEPEVYTHAGFNAYLNACMSARGITDAIREGVAR